MGVKVGSTGMQSRIATVDQLLEDCWRFRPGLLAELDVRRQADRPMWSYVDFEAMLRRQRASYETGKEHFMGCVLLTGLVIVDIDDGLQRIRAIGTQLMASLAYPGLSRALRDRVSGHVEALTDIGLPPPTGTHLQMTLDYYDLLGHAEGNGGNVAGYVRHLLFESYVVVVERKLLEERQHARSA